MTSATFPPNADPFKVWDFEKYMSKSRYLLKRKIWKFNRKTKKKK